MSFPTASGLGQHTWALNTQSAEDLASFGQLDTNLDISGKGDSQLKHRLCQIH